MRKHDDTAGESEYVNRLLAELGTLDGIEEVEVVELDEDFDA